MIRDTRDTFFDRRERRDPGRDIARRHTRREIPVGDLEIGAICRIG